MNYFKNILLILTIISCQRDQVLDNNSSTIKVSVFLSENCPVAQYMTMPLITCFEAFSSDSVEFVAYFPNLLSNAESISNFSNKYSIPFDCIDDNNGEMVSLLGATVYSEVFVEYNNTLIYSGMVDNSYTEIGQWSPPDNNYLYNVLDQLLTGNDLGFSSTTAIGCII